MHASGRPLTGAQAAQFQRALRLLADRQVPQAVALAQDLALQVAWCVGPLGTGERYSICGDRYARNFLKGLAIKYRK